MQTTGLVRVTVATPRRRIDLALPEHAAVAELLPGLLARAGEGLADGGTAGGGWLLRRPDGEVLDANRTLGAHRVRDGEVLHLAPRRLDWPELEYDDVVDAIATGSGRIGQLWGPRHTRWAGLAAGGAALLLALASVLRAGPPWGTAAAWALGAAAVLLAAGVVLARALGDAGAGAVLGAAALPFAFAGGGLLLAGTHPLTGLSAGNLLSGAAALLLVAVLARLGVVAAPALFSAAITVGVLGVLTGWLATTGEFAGYRAAAVVGGAVLALSPTFAPLSLRLGRVPMPVLPRSAADLVREAPQPPLPLVHAAVARADTLLTGMLAGACVVVLGCELALIGSGDTAATWLVGVLAAGFLLRARLYPVPRHRIPVLLAGLSGAGCLAAGPLTASGPLVLAGPVLLAAAGIAVAAGLLGSTRVANPYLPRLAEYAEALLVLAIVPVVLAVLDLYSVVRGLGG
jgi:type VII secretion integral membrane protein EccD